MLLTRQEKVTGWLFVAPALCLVGVFVVWPTAQMIVASFFDVSWMKGLGPPAGTRNYAAAVHDPAFRRSLGNTGLFTVLVVPLQTALALAFAVWVNRPGGCPRVLRACVFIPTTISLAVLSVIWDLMYQPATATGAGLINGLLARVGLPEQPFLTSPAQALPAIAVMSVWQGVGLQMMVFLSGLQSIPAALYEAATLDGAGPWQRFVHVTVPQLAPTTVFVVMVTTIFALRLFVQPYLMTGGGPQGATRSVVQYVYEAAFHARDLGLAFAAGSLFFALVLALTLVLRWLLAKAEVAE